MSDSKNKLLTACCGNSQSSFQYWPTWVKYPEITHELEHINVGGPASGNEFIAQNVIKNIKGIDCAIVVWTGYPKMDFYIESQEIVDEIGSYPTRNFVLNDKGLVIKHAPAWWPSSVSGENRIKDWVNSNIYSKAQQLDQTLMLIAGTQKALEHNNIDYYMFLGDDIPLEKSPEYGIDLNKFVTLKTMREDYLTSHWQKNYSTDNNKHGFVPVAGWHWEFHKKYIIKILDGSFRNKKIDLAKMDVAVQKLTEKKFIEGLS